MTTDLAQQRFALSITVDPSDIDQLGHVNNVVYLRWVQEAAVAHWRAAASEADQATLLWVVVRHEIDYKRPALMGQKIVAHTWVGTATRRAFDRHTEFTRLDDGKVLARVRTVWCPIDAHTGKPTDVCPELRARFSVPS